MTQDQLIGSLKTGLYINGEWTEAQGRGSSAWKTRQPVKS